MKPKNIIKNILETPKRIKHPIKYLNYKIGIQRRIISA
jgi:hypothetical protein